MKKWSAILAALVITSIIGLGLFVVGVNAMTNQNTLPVLNSPSQATTKADPPGTPAAGTTSSNLTKDQQIQQLQALVQQYQQREQQYQTELNSASQQLNQDNTQLQQMNSEIQQVKQLLAVLQQRGIITIAQDGSIYIGGGFDR